MATNISEKCCTDVGATYVSTGTYCIGSAAAGGTYSVAEGKATAIGCALVTPTSSTEQTEVSFAAAASFLVRSHGIWWTGIKKDTDGNWPTYTNWASNQPSDPSEDCVYMLSTGSGISGDTFPETGYKWYDAPCTGSASEGICKFP